MRRCPSRNPSATLPLKSEYDELRIFLIKEVRGGNIKQREILAINLEDAFEKFYDEFRP